MEYIIEFLLELLLDGSIEASKNKKLSKWIRYPLIILISFLFIGVIGLTFLAGVLVYKVNRYLSVLCFVIGIIMLIASIIKFRKTYLSKIENR